jgi:uncharacterized protein YndB with AHSA1/START domain
MTTTSTTDRIEREIILRAPRARVWQALTDSRQFGEWFGIRTASPFAAGKTIHAEVTIKGYEHVPFSIDIVAIEPERLFSWRWHPHAIDAGRDYSNEPTTLVEFHVDDVPGGTRVRVVESGFDQVPPARRLEAFRGNSEGWRIQMENIVRYVER